MYEMSDLPKSLVKGERGIANTAYDYHQELVTPIRVPSEVEKQYNIIVSSVRSIVENVFARMKIFNVLTSPWRHNLNLHYDMFNCIANITNITLKYRPVIQDVNMHYLGHI